MFTSPAGTRIVRVKQPGYRLRNSPVSPSMEAAILNAKYGNAVPLYRQEKDLERYGIHIIRKNMADWTIRCAERYLSVLYDCLHKKLYACHVIQADETPVLVNQDGCPAGSKSYMWVYRSGKMQHTPIVLYEYQKAWNASHPREFLKDFKGVCDRWVSGLPHAGERA